MNEPELLAHFFIPIVLASIAAMLVCIALVPRLVAVELDRRKAARRHPSGKARYTVRTRCCGHLAGGADSEGAELAAIEHSATCPEAKEVRRG